MTVAAPPVFVTAPFRGLSPFGDDELDALLFFGRERETEIAVANLLASRLTILYGPSGVGKTSLLRAGVARSVRELAGRRESGPGPDGIVVVFSAWADDPVDALAAALAAEAASLLGRRVEGPAADARLADIVEHWSLALDAEVYLILDQLEEYFVYRRNAGERRTLVTELPDVVQRPGLRAHVLLSLRDDALAQLDVFKPSIPGLFSNVLRLDRLDRAAATAAILGPVERFNDSAPPERRFDVEPLLVEAVLVQASAGDETDRVEPPFLQLVLERVWNEEVEHGSHALRASTLERLGGTGEIVREHLERALSLLDDEQQAASARMFEHLVTPSGTKVSHRAADLAQFAKVPRAETDTTLAVLCHERILRPLDAGGERGTRFEIFHDVLGGAILGWLRGRDVAAERAAARRHQRRLVTVTFAALAALLVMAAITLYALGQRGTAQSQARSARARALTAAALTELNRDPELSLMLARQAASLSETTLVENVLRRAILDSRVRRVVAVGAPVSAAVFQRGTPLAVALTSSGSVVVADPADGSIVRRFSIAAPRGLLDPSGRHVLAYGLDRRPSLFAVSTGTQLELAASPVTAAVFSPDGALLLTMNRGRRVSLWDAATGTLIRKFTAGSAPAVAAISPDHTLLATGGGRGRRTVEVFDVATGRRVSLLPESSVATHLAFGPGSRLLAVAGADKTIRVQDARTRAAVAIDRGQVGAITGIAFSPRASLLASSSTDGTARVWKTSGGLATILIGHGLYVTSVAFSSDGSRIVTASTDGTARVWHAFSGDLVAVLAGHRDPVTDASFSSDGRSVISSGSDGTVRFWDAVAEPTLAVVAQESYPVAAARATANGIAIAPRGALDVSVAADERSVATAVGSRVEVMRSGGAPIATIAVHAPVTGFALAPDGRTVAIGAGARVGIYTLSGSLVTRLQAIRGRPTRLAFSPDGRFLAAGSTAHTAVVWELATRRARVLEGHSDTVYSARFSPDGRELVTASRDHEVRVWQLATGRSVDVLRAHFGAVSDAGFSPDGRWIVTAGPGKAGLWDAHSGELVFYLQGHEGPLTSASFEPDGVTILTSGVDGTVRRYRCDVCVGIGGLERIADNRLAATHRRLTAVERAEYVP